MADSHTRQAKRQPVTLKIKFKSQTLEQFIERYSVDVSHGGIFIRTKDPLPVGTQMRFEFQLKDATPLIRGDGTVVWTREHDPSRAGVAPGMGVRFDRLADGSQEVLDKILARKGSKHRGSGQTKLPAFTEQPTKVAPSPLTASLAKQQEQPKLGSLAPKRDSFQGGERTDLTPLPSPMPFHSDADDFPEEAFEEATRVASLDSLVAQTVRPDSEHVEPGEQELFSTAKPGSAPGASKQPPSDELATRRKQAEKDEAAAKEAEAKKAKEAEAKKAKEAEAKKAKEAEAKKAKEADDNKAAAKKQDESKKAARGSAPKIASASAVSKKAARAKTAKVEVAKKKSEDVDPQKATAVAAREDSSSAMTYALVAVLALVVIVGGYMMLYGNKSDQKANNKRPTPGNTKPNTNDVTPPPVNKTPPVNVAKKDPPPPPAIETADAKVEATPKGATIALVDGDQSGVTPQVFTKLDKSKTFKARVSHPGFVTQEVDVTPGGETVKVALLEMKRIFRLKSEPAGAMFSIDGWQPPGKNGRRMRTPAEVDVSKSKRLLRKKQFQIVVRLRGYKPWTVKFAPKTGFSASGDVMAYDVVAKLEKRKFVPIRRPRPPVDKPPVDKPPVDKPPVDKPPVDKPPVDKPPVDKPPVDKPPVDKPPVNKPPVNKPPVKKPPVKKPPVKKTDPKPDEPKPDWM